MMVTQDCHLHIFQTENLKKTPQFGDKNVPLSLPN